MLANIKKILKKIKVQDTVKREKTSIILTMNTSLYFDCYFLALPIDSTYIFVFVIMVIEQSCIWLFSYNYVLNIFHTAAESSQYLFLVVA